MLDHKLGLQLNRGMRLTDESEDVTRWGESDIMYPATGRTVELATDGAEGKFVAPYTGSGSTRQHAPVNL